MACKCKVKSSDPDNLSAVLYGINDMRMEQRPIPVPNDNQVLLRVEAVGICGSDVHYLVDGKCGRFVVEKPMVIGHEAAGTVIGLGKNVTTLVPGDRVAIEPGISCRMCQYCKEGNYNLCPNLFFCATPPDDGNLSRFYVHDADFCHKLPDNMSHEEGVLMEPLSVGVHSCKKGKVTVGSVVLIFGAGPIGLVTLMAAKAYGASKVIVTDLVDHRLQKAKQLGADFTMKFRENTLEDKFVQEILMLLGEQPTVSIDCAGAEICVRVALSVTKTGGIVVLTGIGKDEMNISLSSVITREVDLRGVFRYHNDYPVAIEMVKTGKVNVKPLITHHFSLEDTLKAFNVAITKEGNPIKILIHPNPAWKKPK